MLDQFGQRIAMQGMKLEQYMQLSGMTREGMMEQLKPQAETKIRSRLCMEAVAAAENLTASEEEEEKEMQAMAEAYQLEVDKVKEMLGEKEQESIRKDIAVRKAIEFVAENAKVKKASKKSGKTATKKKEEEEKKDTEEKAE